MSYYFQSLLNFFLSSQDQGNPYDYRNATK